MTRRRVRLGKQLGELADALEQVEGHAGALSVAPLILKIRQFLMPRLTDPPPPLVVAFVGSTGAGKSTLVNSLAGSTVGKSGILRPTTRQPVVWTGASHAGRPWPGQVVVGAHPLAESVALIDTPDLDSDVVEHRVRAMEALAISDAAVFVTTASRYGDASPWEVLASIVDKPVVVVINRLPTRASGARNDLTARLRSHGLGSIPVLTISEQRVDPVSGLLKPQSVQRLSLVLREWAGKTTFHRTAAAGAATDQLARDLTVLIGHLEEESSRAARAAKGVMAAYGTAAAALAPLAGAGGNTKKLPKRRRDLEVVVGRTINVLETAAAAAVKAMESEGFDAPPTVGRAALAALPEHPAPRRNRTLAKTDRPKTDRPKSDWPKTVWIEAAIEEDRRRFLERLESVPEDLLERLRNGAALIDDLDWRSV
ncbi:MAG TPA: GTPase domain-containing protein [Acidimicrobiia bacterium]|nr:GTPase domain-containing protein [Acidimicrobiia bacterium]